MPPLRGVGPRLASWVRLEEVGSMLRTEVTAVDHSVKKGQ